jgi:hypothetical protein
MSKNLKLLPGIMIKLQKSYFEPGIQFVQYFM